MSSRAWPDLDLLPGRAEEHGRRADLADAVDRHHELRPVRRHHGHPVAGADPPGDEVAPEGGAGVVQLAEGPPLVARQHGVAVAEPLRGPVQRVVHQGGHREDSSRLRRSTSTSAECIVLPHDPGAVPPPATAPTDPEVRQEIIETVRRFVANEVIPVASALEHDDAYPADIVAQMRELGLFGVTIPEAYGGLGPRPAHLHRHHRGAGLRVDEPDRGHQHPHHGGHADHGARERRAEAALAPGHGGRRPPRRPVAVGARRRQRHPQHLLQGGARRRRVRRQRHQGLGDQRRAGRASSPWPPAPRRGSPPSSWRRSPARGPGASRSAATWASSATGASRRSRCPTSTTASRPPTSSARPAAGCPRSSACSRSGGSTSPPGPSASPGPPSTPPSPTPASARPSASPSPSTRPSSSSWPTWPPASRRPAC